MRTAAAIQGFELFANYLSAATDRIETPRSGPRQRARLPRAPGPIPGPLRDHVPPQADRYRRPRRPSRPDPAADQGTGQGVYGFDAQPGAGPRFQYQPERSRQMTQLSTSEIPGGLHREHGA